MEPAPRKMPPKAQARPPAVDPPEEGPPGVDPPEEDVKKGQLKATGSRVHKVTLGRVLLKTTEPELAGLGNIIHTATMLFKNFKDRFIDALKKGAIKMQDPKTKQILPQVVDGTLATLVDRFTPEGSQR